MLPFRRRALAAAAVAALFAAPGCSVFSEAVGRLSPPTTATTSLPMGGGGPSCVILGDGTMACSTPGRPFRRRRRRGLLLPLEDGAHDDEARIEYASVASFGELGLELMALGAPTALVTRCHRAAIDEIGHATILDQMAGRDGSRFGAIPHLLGRRIGGRVRSRRRHLARIAVASYRDGWLNEGLSASDMEARAHAAASVDERRAFERIAAEERGHAELARDVVLWCFEESPQSVGRALARAQQSSRVLDQSPLPAKRRTVTLLVMNNGGSACVASVFRSRHVRPVALTLALVTATVGGVFAGLAGA